MNEINFTMNGLTCEACVKVATSRFKKVPGVEEVAINLQNGATRVTSSADLDLDILAQSLEGTHYSIVK